MGSGVRHEAGHQVEGTIDTWLGAQATVLARWHPARLGGGGRGVSLSVP